MKKITMICAAMISLALMIACKSDNSSDKGVWSFQLPGSKTETTNIKANGILNTKWIIGGDERPKERAVYLFIKQDSSVVVAYDGADNEYGYVYEMDERCIKIKINAYNSRATNWDGSWLFIDKKNNHLYNGLDAYKSKDPRKRQSIEQIPMSEYRGQRVKVEDRLCQTNPMPSRIIDNKETENVAITSKQTDTTPKTETVFLFQGKRTMNTNGEESSVGCPSGVDGNMGSSYTLAGRSAVSLPAPTYNSNAQGTVVIQIWVDRDGKVIKAEYSPKGSNTSNGVLIQEAQRAALKSQFNPDKNENGPEVQKGSIKYVFKTI